MLDDRVDPFEEIVRDDGTRLSGPPLQHCDIGSNCSANELGHAFNSTHEVQRPLPLGSLLVGCRADRTGGLGNIRERTIDRAAGLASSTLKYGRADEKAPELEKIDLAIAADDAAADALAGFEGIRYREDVEPGLSCIAGRATERPRREPQLQWGGPVGGVRRVSWAPRGGGRLAQPAAVRRGHARPLG